MDTMFARLYERCRRQLGAIVRRSPASSEVSGLGGRRTGKSRGSRPTRSLTSVSWIHRLWHDDFGGSSIVNWSSPPPYTMPPVNTFAVSRLLAAASRPAFSRQLPRAVRWQTSGADQSKTSSTSVSAESPTASSSEPPSPVHLTKAEVKRPETGAQAQPRHTPDYDAVIDYRTS